MTRENLLAKRYERIHKQLKDLLSRTENRIAHMATTAALLHHKMPHYFWTGFYLVDKEDLIVGPYQGPLACQILDKPKGACWAAVIQKKSIVIPNVHEYPGHVACDSRSNSEIVVPLFNSQGEPWAVLDVDSLNFDTFSAVDKEWLERIVQFV